MQPPLINLSNAAELYHLASGSARLSGALVTMLRLALAVLIRTVIVGWFGVVDRHPVDISFAISSRLVSMAGPVGIRIRFRLVFNAEQSPCRGH